MATAILKDETFQGRVVELLAAVDAVDDAVVQERYEPAAAETEGEIGALQAFIVLPEIQVMGNGVVADAIGQGAHSHLRPSHEGGAFVESAVIIDHQVIGQLHHADPHGRFLNPEAALQCLLPEEHDCLHEPRFATRNAAVAAAAE